MTERELENQVLSPLIERLTQGIDWTTGQLPEAVQQLLLWYTISYSIPLVICFIFIILSFRWYFKCVEVDWNDKKFFPFTGFIISTSLAVMLTLAVGLPAFFNLLKITITPKIWIIEYIKDYI